MEFNKLIPELTVSDIQQSKFFYTEVLGFSIEYERVEDKFAFLSLGKAQLMIEEENGNWDTGLMEYPFGRGINFQIDIENLNQFVAHVKEKGIVLFKDTFTSHYQCGGICYEEKEVLIQDPDGYLLRFSETQQTNRSTNKQGYTNRVKLIDWRDSDANSLFEMCLDNTLRKNGIPYYDTIEDAKNVIKHWKNMRGSKVIIEKETNSFVGFIMLSDMNRYDSYMELEYAIAEKYRNKGYATNAIKKMIDYGFREMNLCVIAAWVRSHNEPSVKCLENNHFTFEGKLRKHARDKGDTLCYSILREEWENANKDNFCEIEDKYKD